MKLKLIGKKTTNNVAVIGTFDPFSESHIDLLSELVNYSVSHKKNSLVLLLNPPPSAFVNGLNQWPIFDDVKERIKKIKKLGIDSIAVIEFSEEDFKTDAYEFLNFVRKKIEIHELWMGSRQTLGSGPNGKLNAVKDYCTQSNVSLQIIESASKVPVESGKVRLNLKNGDLKSAYHLLGRYPVVYKNKNKFNNLPWKKGMYKAEYNHQGDSININVVETAVGEIGFFWPLDDVKKIIITEYLGELNS